VTTKKHAEGTDEEARGGRKGVSGPGRHCCEKPQAKTKPKTENKRGGVWVSSGGERGRGQRKWGLGWGKMGAKEEQQAGKSATTEPESQRTGQVKRSNRDKNRPTNQNERRGEGKREKKPSQKTMVRRGVLSKRDTNNPLLQNVLTGNRGGGSSACCPTWNRIPTTLDAWALNGERGDIIKKAMNRKKRAG